MANDKDTRQDDKTASDTVPLEIIEAAGAWLGRLTSKSISSEERTAFAAWLKKSPVHVSEFLQLSALRAELTGSLQRHPEWVDVLLQSNPGNVVEMTDRRNSEDAVTASSAAPVPVPGSVQQSVPGKRLRIWATVAAIAVVSVAGWFGYHSVTDTPKDASLVTTALGEQRSILLSDGSTLELNTETEVRVRISEHARDIDLLRGELLVDVARDPNRPFRVRSDGVVARAIGTRFNVYKREGDTVVTVIEGRVAVNQAPSAPNATKGSEDIGTVELTAGLQIAVASFPIAAPSPELTPEPVDLDKATAWTERRLMFDDEPLSTIVSEFNRYNRSRLIITGATLNDKRLSGVFDANDPDEFIALLSSLERIDVQRSSEGHRTLLRVDTTNSEQQDNF